MPFVQTDDIETYYERRGEGRSIVFVHGAWVDHRMWDRQVEALATNYDAIAYDVRGHGRTGPSTERRYTVDRFASDLKALVDALELDRPIVCGLSLGGMIAQAYAARYPDAVSTLILAGTVVSTRFTAHDKLLSLVAPRWATKGTVRLLGPRRYVDTAFRLATVTRSRDWFGRDETVRAYVRQTMERFDTAEYNKIVDAIYGFRGVELGSIRVPTLVLNGEFESPSVFDHAAHIERTLPDVRSRVIPDAGHIVNMENATAFTDAIVDFLAERR
ncbi:alpha/beta fold hydrolase (plasmid) [Haloferacaceae archaeon DSL9]